MLTASPIRSRSSPPAHPGSARNNEQYRSPGYVNSKIYGATKGVPDDYTLAKEHSRDANSFLRKVRASAVLPSDSLNLKDRGNE